MLKRVTVRTRGARKQSYAIEIGAQTLDRLGETAQRVLPVQARRVIIISNPKVFALYGEQATGSLAAAGYAVAHWLMGEGERYKSLRTLGEALEFFGAIKLERSDAVVALGGGVVGDLAGFASATYLRGISFLQVPTTLLAQIDASVGGKTGINTGFGKNMVGAFHQPRAVIIDVGTLDSLPRREQLAGWCEAIKQGAIGSRKLFEQTYAFLATEGTRQARSSSLSSASQPDGDQKRLCDLIAAQCAFKASIVANDEREQIDRTDHLSRRILNFGHTFGHALEAVTRYKRFRHGEAVGYGMLAAGEISVKMNLLDASELELLRAAVCAAGRLPRADDLDQEEILGAVAHDKKSVGGRVKWILLERIGRARVVDGGEIPTKILRDALRRALAPTV